MKFYLGTMQPYNSEYAGGIDDLGLGPFDTFEDADYALDEYLRNKRETRNDNPTT